MNAADANVAETDIVYKNLDAFEVVDILRSFGINDFTIDETKNCIKLLNFDTNNLEISEQQAYKVAERLGENYGKTAYRFCQSSLIDAGMRKEMYRSWLGTDLWGRQLGDTLRQAQDANRQLRRRIEEETLKSQGAGTNVQQDVTAPVATGVPEVLNAGQSNSVPEQSGAENGHAVFSVSSLKKARPSAGKSGTKKRGHARKHAPVCSSPVLFF